MAERRIVIVGGVAAGPKVACRLRRLDPEAEITILDQDSLISYGGCGIPYFVSGDVQDEKELRSTSFHMLRDERFFREAKGVEVRTRTRALAVDRERKVVKAQDLETGEALEFPYDKLVLATGSRPVRLPIPGVDLDGVFTIDNLGKAIEIKERLASGKVEKAVIIGGGAIGLEMAEAFTDLWGVETSVVEFMPHVLPRIVDPPIARMLEQHMREHGVKIYTGEGAKEILGEGGRVRAVATPERELPADLVVMAVGVRPRSELAKEAGLLVSPFGGIIVDQRMRTSDPDIYAAGDCVETLNPLTGRRTYAPLGSLANRQGRVVADNLAGIPSKFTGVVGSFVMKAFEVAVGAAGLSLEAAEAEGIEAESGLAVQADRAHFFPTQALMFVSLVAERRTRRVLGVQAYGKMGDGVMARVNAAVGLLSKGASVEDFSNLELAYAPPFSNAVDVLNTAANVTDNILSGRMKTVPIEDFVAWMDGTLDRPDWAALDLRHPKEAAPWVERFGERWIAIPYDEVRSRSEELPSDKVLLLICNSGTRSYEIQRFLEARGGPESLVLPGGLNVIKRLGVSWWVS